MKNLDFKSPISNILHRIAPKFILFCSYDTDRLQTTVNEEVIRSVRMYIDHVRFIGSVEGKSTMLRVYFIMV